MRRLMKLVGVLSVAAWLGAVTGPVQARVDASGDVKSLDKNIYEALASRDQARLAGVLDDGFVLTNTFGAVFDKQKFLSACCTGEAASKTLSLGAADVQVKTYGESTAVVLARTEMKFVRDNQNQTLSWRSLRVYIRSGATWKLVAEQRTTIN